MGVGFRGVVSRASPLLIASGTAPEAFSPFRGDAFVGGHKRPRPRTVESFRASFGELVVQAARDKSGKQLVKVLQDVGEDNPKWSLEAALQARSMGVKLDDRHWGAVVDSMNPKRGRIDTMLVLRTVQEMKADRVTPYPRWTAQLAEVMTLARMPEETQSIIRWGFGKKLEDIPPHLTFTLIRVFHRGGQIEKALDTFRRIEKDEKEDTPEKIFTYMISALGKHGRLDEAKMIFQKKLESDKPFTVSVINSMMVAYNACKQPEGALQLRRYFKERNLVEDVSSYNAILQSYMALDQPLNAIEIFNDMKAKKLPWDKYTAMSIIKAYSQIGNTNQARRIADQLAKSGRADIHVWNALMDAFAKNREMDKADEHLHRMYRLKRTPDVVTYNTLILGYACAGNRDKAVEMFEKLKKEGLRPNERSYHPIIMNLSETGDPGGAKIWMERMKSAGFEPDSRLYEVMLSGLARGAIKGQHPGPAMRVLAEMKTVGIEPNSESYSVLVQALSRQRDLDGVEKIMAEMREKNLTPTSDAYAAAISVLGENKKLHEATKIFISMGQQGVVRHAYTYNSLIGAYVRSSDFSGAMEVLSEMDERKVLADERTFGVMLDQLLRLRFEHMDKTKKAAEAKGETLKFVPERQLQRLGDGRIEFADKIMEQVEKRKIRTSGRFVHSAVKLYVEQDKLDRAKEIFDSLSRQSKDLQVETVNLLMLEANRKKMPDIALELFRLAKQNNLNLDHTMLSLVTTAYGVVGRTDKLDEIPVLAQNAKLTLEPVNYSSLVLAYLRNDLDAKAADVILRAEEHINLKWDQQLLSAAIEAYARIGDSISVRKIWKRFREHNINQGARAISAMFVALGKDRDAGEVRKFMTHLVNSKAKLTEWNRRKMVEALLRCGETSEGLEVLSEVLKFQRIEKPRIFYEEVTAQLKNSGQFLSMKRVDSYFAKRYPEALSAKLRDGSDSQEVLPKAGDANELVQRVQTVVDGVEKATDVANLNGGMNEVLNGLLQIVNDDDAKEPRNCAGRRPSSFNRGGPLSQKVNIAEKRWTCTRSAEKAGDWSIAYCSSPVARNDAEIGRQSEPTTRNAGKYEFVQLA
ncbi:hypothetical protein NDN08_003369 [Rhodosorus marinus]|uniref:Pentacotripeptide-repeat region of PRORP domain-containing protein n=1 Tax=Rhodosorus marinus TaxID=101924 RepID=A0AAV8UWA7_9RHOD|nr:hypothetical protein NDN08_003369 [Rhodosorus marinus]